MKFEKISKASAVKFCESKGYHLKMEDYNSLPLPTRSTAKSSGYDFFIPFDCYINPLSQLLIPTFIKADLDVDKVLEIYPRSSYGIKKGIVLANTVGIIDADYYNNPDNEGHILVCLKNTSNQRIVFNKGDKFCQGIIKQYFLVDGDEYGVGKERVGGIGSSGK